jgi:hypothetical protein
MTPDHERYAIYWAPDAAHPLWAAGCEWLGRDPSLAPAGTGLKPPRPNVATPARYGFHATLKAPIRLAAGSSRADLQRAAAALARRHRVFEMPALHVAWLQDFVAVRPVVPLHATHPLRQLADACVRDLDDHRAPAPAGEVARRAAQTADGDPSGLALLARWGYAHVFDGWRFHMTLSDRFDDRDSDAARQLEHDARAWFSRSLGEPLHCTALCIFHEAGAGEPFRLIERLPLEGAA